MSMANFFEYRTQCFLLSVKLGLKKCSPPLKLLLKNARPRLPRERHPGQKSRPFTLPGPFFLFERVCQRGRSLRRCLEGAALRPRSRLIGLLCPDQSCPRQFLKRVVVLRQQNSSLSLESVCTLFFTPVPVLAVRPRRSGRGDKPALFFSSVVLWSSRVQQTL